MLLWSGERWGVSANVDNLVMIFFTKKRLNTELVFDRMTSLYLGITRIHNVTNKRNQSNVVLWLEECVYLVQNCYVDFKGAGIRDQVTTFPEMSLIEMWWK